MLLKNCLSKDVCMPKLSYQTEYTTALVMLALLAFWTLTGIAADQVPGVVIDHQPASGKQYIGSPSLTVWTNGDYIASHDFFGPKSTEGTCAVTAVFRSHDRGATWQKIATVDGQFWSSLFVNQGALYLLGTDRHHGNVIIRRSLDGGAAWSTPTIAATGLLRDDGEYHCAPTPILVHSGRLWRGFERRMPPLGWGSNYCAGMFSVPINADLLNAANWTVSNFLPSNRSWNGGDMAAWLEGNAVVTPAGQVVDILRVDTTKYPEKAAIVTVSPDGRTLNFDPANGFINFPGGAKKFTIQRDGKSGLYWTLANSVEPKDEAAGRPASIRNTLALFSSPDLTHWTQRVVLLAHPEIKKHGFQYVDWQFEGDDIIVACRTAFDDGLGGAHTYHDANYLTFHRIDNFRRSASRP
jgi:hypothetical protein